MSCFVVRQYAFQIQTRLFLSVKNATFHRVQSLRYRQLDPVWNSFFRKTLHPNERRMNVDFKKLGDGSERISMCVHPDRQEFFLFAPAFIPCRNKLATAFFTFVALFALYKASFYVFV